MSPGTREELEPRLEQWRAHVSRHAEETESRVSLLESQLNRVADSLMSAGLNADEAFLVALKRIAEDDEPTRVFAREYADGLLTAPAAAEREVLAPLIGSRTEFLVMLACAIAAAVAIKLPVLFGMDLDGAEDFYLLNVSFFVLPFLVAFFAWMKRPPTSQLAVVAGVFLGTAVVANGYPFADGGSTQALTVIHLPILLWLMVGVVSAAGEWRFIAPRMRFTRFTGEWFITFVLIAAGGGVLSGLTIAVFESIGITAEPFVTEWVVPCGAMGAVIVAAWLAETRRNVVGGIAPMLARLFTPLFAVMLLTLVVGVMWTRGFVDVEREVLILFDVLLALVLALLLYGISARDPRMAPGFFDRIQLVLLSSAIAVDLFALVSIAVRLSQYGFSANKTAALGLNLILLVNLVWAAYLQVGFLRSRRTFEDVEAWQMRYLPVYALWAAVVVVVFPPLFGFV